MVLVSGSFVTTSSIILVEFVVSAKVGFANWSAKIAKKAGSDENIASTIFCDWNYENYTAKESVVHQQMVPIMTLLTL